MILETKESTHLHYRDLRSDKVYHVQLDRADGGYVVNFQFGRRGSSLQSGTKTPQPLCDFKHNFAANKAYPCRCRAGDTFSPTGSDRFGCLGLA
jgi:bifunctional non-homologous end joining protein LigD